MIQADIEAAIDQLNKAEWALNNATEHLDSIKMHTSGNAFMSAKTNAAIQLEFIRRDIEEARRRMTVKRSLCYRLRMFFKN